MHRSKFFFFQLPDSLPGHGPDDEIGESAAAEQAAAQDDPVGFELCLSKALIILHFVLVLEILYGSTA